MKTTIFTFLIGITIFIDSGAQKISDWRMENRKGVSSETGLLKSWPEEGPELLWTFNELKSGYSSPTFGENSIFITGRKDTMDILYSLDMEGKLLWSVPMGRAWNGSFPDSRVTATVEENRVYTCSGLGDLACINANEGDMIWSYKASEIHQGTYGRWGISEALLIDGDMVFFTPGGEETTTIALNKNTGELIWKTKSIGDQPTYVSPVLVEYAGYKMLINTTMNFVFGVDVSKGDILWKFEQVLPENFNTSWEVIKCVTHLFNEGKVYITTGYDVGAFMIRIAEDGKNAELVWTDSVLDVHHGGVVLLDGYIYGSNWLNNGNGNWCCIDWETGEKKWEEHWNCKGSIIAAEGMLYIYDEKRGNVGLVNASPEKFDLVSSFQVVKGKNGPHWAHPVIHKGVLYLRHNNVLMAYNIKGL